MNLSGEQRERYLRQTALPEIGVAGQKKLFNSRVLLVGAGGLGSSAGFYLAAAGVGAIGVLDPDLVETTNLQRQILHSTADIGTRKVTSAARSMRALNPDVTVKEYPERLNADNGRELVSEYDFVIDASDNMQTKFLVADLCHFSGKPYSHAGIRRFSGQLMTVLPRESACCRCIFGELDPVNSPQERIGPLGALAGVVGTLQATEAIKCLLGIGDLLSNRLLIYDALKASFRTVDLKKNKHCPLCGEHSPRREPETG